MKCENCRAYCAHVIEYKDKSGTVEERFLLCPRCLSILKNLNNEYLSIVSTDEVFSSGNIVSEHAE